MKRIHIFTTGTHTDSHGHTLSFSEADLAACIAAYDPSIHQAPIVVGHPKTDDPAYGWVQALTSDGGNLYALPEQVNPEFSEQVLNGSYKKVSASFYPPNSPANPVKGLYYLRHVGFLGAEPPAIKGLQPVEFSESCDTVTVTVDFSEANGTAHHQSLFEQFVSSLRTLFFGEAQTSTPTNLTLDTADNTAQDTVNKDTPMNDTTNALPTPPTATPAATATPVPAVAPAQQPHPTVAPIQTGIPTSTDKDAEIAKLQQQLADKEAAEAKAKQKENADFAEGLVTDGKIAPKDKALVTAILDGLDTATANQPLEFGEGDSKLPLKQAVKDKLAAADGGGFAHLFSESAGLGTGGSTGHATGSRMKGFDVPAGTAVDGDRLALHEQAVNYAETHKVDYATAVMAISG